MFREDYFEHKNVKMSSMTGFGPKAIFIFSADNVSTIGAVGLAIKKIHWGPLWLGTLSS